MDKIKIGFILSGLGHISRGTEIVFTEVMKGLSFKEDLEIFAFGGGKDFNLPGVDYTWVPTLKRHWFNHFPKIKRLHLTHGHDYEGLFFALSLIPKILTNKLDIIIFSSFPYGLLPLKIYTRFRSKKTKIVFTVGGGSSFFYSRFFLADRVITKTPEYQRLFSKKFSSVCIPNGVDIDVFKPKKVSRKEFNLPAKKFIVFSSSAFDSIKRIDFLIKAVSQIDNAYLLLAGSGPQESYLKKLGRQLMGENIRFLGVLDQATLVKYYCLADVFCLPSATEPFGIVLIEAMACQTPVVTNNTEAQQWIVRNGGSCVDVKNENILIKAIEKYKDRKLAEETGQKGRKNVRERFTWDIVSQEYYNLFKGLINK